MKKEIQKFIDSKLSQEQEKSLLEAVKNDDELSEEVYSQMQMNESLKYFFPKEEKNSVDSIMKEIDKLRAVDQVMSEVKKFEHNRSRRRFIISLAACAALLICSFLIPYHLNDTATDKIAAVDESAVEFQALPVAKMHRLTLENGVQVSLKGPAEYFIESPMKIRLNKGMLIASVPKNASGFTVSTPDGLVRDISTKFSVRVTSGKTEVSVIKGEVEVRLHHESQFTRLKELNKISLFPKTISPPSVFEASGNIISINFGGYAEVKGETGAEPASNWNNVGAPLHPRYLEDNTGDPLWTTVKLNNSTVWKATYVNGKTQSSNLFLGRLIGGAIINTRVETMKPLEIYLKGIPYDKYDVYVYYWQGRNNDKHIFTLQANDGPIYNITRHNKESSVNEFTFSRWQGEGENRSGNYFVFEDLEGENALIKAAMPNRTDVHRQWHISGLQIISRD